MKKKFYIGQAFIKNGEDNYIVKFLNRRFYYAG